jgi:hypothetical protein
LKQSKKGLKQSGLQTYGQKTEMCLFYKSNVTAVTVRVGNNQIISKIVINMFDVLFDTQPCWSQECKSKGQQGDGT